VGTPRIVLLGPPTSSAGDGDDRRLAGRQQALLALLALRAPHPVRTDALVDALWGDDLPADPANALQQRISALRKRVGADQLRATGGGYALRVDDDDIDARRFERLAQRGRELLRAGDPAGARIELDAALALWHGDALEGLAHEPWAVADAARLDERRLAAEEDRADAALALGSADDVVPDATHRLASHPLRERTAAQLMLALAASGRQADALAVHDRTRRRLVDELGADPGPALQHAHRRVLDHASDVPAAGDRPETDDLPAARERLVGRSAELAALTPLLDEHRLVTVVGPGGTGKTVLALEAARRHERPAAGTRFVDLTHLTEPDATVGHLARILGVGPTGLGAASLDLDGLVAGLRGRRLLLVLDDATPEGAAAVVDALLAGAPGVRVLATAHVPLGVAGERRFPLGPLAPPEGDDDVEAILAAPATELFVERVRAHDPWYELDPAEAHEVAALVRELDGLPLALELAAAQLRTRTVAELRGDLAAGRALTDDTRPGPRRHRSLDAVLDSAWRDLDPAARTAWAALSVTAGPVEPATAATLLVAAGLDDPNGALVTLADRALVALDREGGRRTLRLLGTVRSYGRRRLDELDTAATVAAAHADLVQSALDAAVRRGEPTRFPVDLERQAVWLDEARSALRWAADVDDRARVQRLAGRLGWVWLLHGLAAEGRGWLDRGLPPVTSSTNLHDLADVDPDAVLWASGLRIAVGDPDAVRWAAFAVELAPTPADRVVAGVTAAVHALHAGDLDGCTARLAEADGPATTTGGWPLGFHRVVRAQVGRLTGQLGHVREDAEAALATLGNDAPWARAMAVDVLIDAELDAAGDPPPRSVLERTRQLATEALGWCADGTLPELESRLRLQLGRALHGLGAHELGRHHLDHGVLLARRAGAEVALGFALLVAGTVALDRGDVDSAVTALEEAETRLRGTGAPYGAVEAAATLSAALRRADRHLDADAARQRAATAASGDPALEARVLAASSDSGPTGS
jgi:predicted ATPase/DNA-binding SARP family transcriptional activator